jgi:hypothetical protein
MKTLPVVIAVVLGAAGARADSFRSALAALEVLPKLESERLAVIAGCEGNPEPDRWHFLVYAPETENGLREYVVSEQKIVARREFSQFAEKLRPEDVVGNSIKVDSDRLAYVVERFAHANRKDVMTINYDLRKDGPTLAPVWRVECFDADNRSVGAISVAATASAVLAHSGFSEPPTFQNQTQAVARTEPSAVAERLPANGRAAASRPDSRAPRSRNAFRGEAPPFPGDQRVINAAEDEDKLVERKADGGSRWVVVRRAQPANLPDAGRRVEAPVRRFFKTIFED